jgi:hypothetical protein
LITLFNRLNMLSGRRLREVKTWLAPIFDALNNFRGRWRACGFYVSALFVFAASRLVVFIGLKLGNLLVPDPGGGHWDAGPYWYDKLLRWDSGLFAGIVRDGYTNGIGAGASITTGSFPLYPVVSYAVKTLFGVNEFLALLLVANLASLATSLLIAKFFKDELGDETALLSASFFWFFPYSIFLSAGYSESLFLSFVLLGFVLLRKERFVLAAVAAGLSLGARSVGLAMLPAVLWEVWQRNNAPKQLLVPKMILCGILALSGLLVFMLFLALQFGDPFAFVTAQSSWHTPLLERLVSGSVFHPFRHMNIRIGGWFFCFVALSVWSFWRLRTSVSLYGLGVLMIPYITVGITDSADRFVMMCLPAFMCLGAICKKHPVVSVALIGVFSALLLRNSALFSQWYWLG